MQIDLGRLATGRVSDLFQADLEARRSDLTQAIRGARILVIGGAGSIGQSSLHHLDQRI